MVQDKKKLERSPFSDYIGIEVVDLEQGFVRLRLSFSEKLTQPYGVLHGGVIVSLADSAVAKALSTMIKPDERIAAIEIKCNFLIAIEEGTITAEAKIIHKGTRTAVGEVNIWDNEHRLVAKTIATYAIMK